MGGRRRVSIEYFILGSSWVLLYIVSSAVCQRVTLYEHYNKQGSSLQLKPRKCTELPGQWQERASSIDSHGSCVMLFENTDCTGKYMRLRPGTATFVPNLKRLRFNDMISSVRPCDFKNLLPRGRYAIQNAEDKKFLTARSLLAGFTMVETEKWKQKISQQWDIEKNRDGTYWLIPRIHFSKNPLTYDMRKYNRDTEDFPETGMFKEREYWVLENIKGKAYMIRNDDTGKCLVMEDDSEIEQDDCDKTSRNQQWMFHRL